MSEGYRVREGRGLGRGDWEKKKKTEVKNEERDRETDRETERDGPEFKGPSDAIAKPSDQKCTSVICEARIMQLMKNLP